jgi:NAD(P)-dependent dehydrogenase (short-subunit alcohol dehydrogenase family)
MHIALRLLRDGADTTITTRFPRDAVRRFTSMPDSADWLHRLHVVGIDLRDPAQVIALADEVAARGPLDVLVNNAAQTVRRSPGAYGHLVAAESAPLPSGPLPELVDLGHATDAHPPALTAGPQAFTPHAVTALALASGSASLDRVADRTAIDAGGLVPDLDEVNSWTRTVSQVDALEMLEVQLCNAVAPFVLVGRLRPSLAASPARRTYVVNVSAMEGQFARGYKGAGHPHTNMAKAALNMLTRTSAQEMLEQDGILMTAVDTGWITDERPHPTKARLHEEGFAAPLDLVDGAARVYDPVVRGEAGEDLLRRLPEGLRAGALVGQASSTGTTTSGSTTVSSSSKPSCSLAMPDHADSGASTTVSLWAPQPCSSATTRPSSGAIALAQAPKTRPSAPARGTRKPQSGAATGAALATGVSGPASPSYHRSAASARPSSDSTRGRPRPSSRERLEGQRLGVDVGVGRHEARVVRGRGQQVAGPRSPGCTRSLHGSQPARAARPRRAAGPPRRP